MEKQKKRNKIQNQDIRRGLNVEILQEKIQHWGNSGIDKCYTWIIIGFLGDHKTEDGKYKY
jgi:hypothetical protein